MDLKNVDLAKKAAMKLRQIHSPGKKVVFIDGVFDLYHLGHANALRQAKALGDILVVGVNSEHTIRVRKGKPILSDRERYKCVKACRFVDVAIPNTPYVMDTDYIDYLIAEYKIDYFVHGDDLIVLDGEDIYAEIKRRGMFKVIPRTHGISTTEILKRILCPPCEGPRRHTIYATIDLLKNFLTSAQRPPGRVVYVDGEFDMLNTSHIDFLKRARKENGGYLIAGVFSDTAVRDLRLAQLQQHQLLMLPSQPNQVERLKKYPIMSMNERVMTLLSCKYVDDVLLDAPIEITLDLIDLLGIGTVARASRSIDMAFDSEEKQNAEIQIRKRFREPHALGILREVVLDGSFYTSDIIDRIEQHRDLFEEDLKRKLTKEESYYQEKLSALQKRLQRTPPSSPP